VATLEDYATVRGLIGGMYESAVTGATEGVRRVVEAVKGGAKTVAQVNEAVEQMAGSRPSKQSVSRWIGMALAGEWIQNDEANPRRPKALSPGGCPLPDRVSLPTGDEILALSPLSRVAEYTGGMSLEEADRVVIKGTYGDLTPSYGRTCDSGTAPETDNGNKEIASPSVVPPEISPMGLGQRVGQPSGQPDSPFCSDCQRWRCQCGGSQSGHDGGGEGAVPLRGEDYWRAQERPQ
jgi:hypothetical protein